MTSASKPYTSDSTTAATVSTEPGPVDTKLTGRSASMMSWKSVSSLSAPTDSTAGSADNRVSQDISVRSKATPSEPAICAPMTPGALMIWMRVPSVEATAVRFVASRVPAPGSL